MDKIKYIFNFTKNNLTIKIETNFRTKWKLGEGWGEEIKNDFNVLTQYEYSIVYKVLPRREEAIQNLEPDFGHVIILNEYACFTGSIGLFFPELDKYKKIKVIFKTNFPLFISSIGKINRKHEKSLSIDSIDRLLFVFTKHSITKDLVTITYFKDSYKFLDLKNIANIISKFIKKCYIFFGIKEDIKFIINYIGFKTTGTITGNGGNGNFGGFNFFIFDKKKSLELSKKIYFLLLHELFHHFNRSNSDYSMLWFSEGFTEFFCRYLSLKEKDFIKEANKFIEMYHINPYKNNDISILTKDNFFKNKYVEKLPYYKGFVYALYLYRKDKNNFLKNYKKLILNVHSKNQIINIDDFNTYFEDQKFVDYIIKGDTIFIESKKTKEIHETKINFDFLNPTEKIYINYEDRTVQINEEKIKTDSGKKISIPKII